MKLSSFESSVRKWTTDQIYEQLRISSKTMDVELKFILCDQLLLRHKQIRFVNEHFEAVVNVLNTSNLRFIDQHDDRFSKAAVHVAVNELIRRNKPVSQWFFRDFDHTQGPVNRMDLDDALSSTSVNWVWKEGWKEWRKVELLPFLTASLFYDQEFPQARESKGYHNFGMDSKQTGDQKHIARGVLTLIGFPLWVVACFALPIHGFHTFSGWFAPLVFSLAMLVLTVPMGIGLLLGKIWASSFSVVTSAICVAWFVAVWLSGNLGLFWITMGLYQIIILTLAAVVNPYSKKIST